MPEPDGEVVTLRLASDVTAPSLARRFVVAHADGLPAPLAQDAELLVSELVTNAVLHGRPGITVRVSIRPPEIGFAVSDEGDGFDSARDVPPAVQTHGRGLLIVAAVAREHGVSLTQPPPGKTVWFTLWTADYA